MYKFFVLLVLSQNAFNTQCHSALKQRSKFGPNPNSRILGEYHGAMYFQYNNCWKETVAAINSSCGNMTEDVQSRLGISLTNCFLEKNQMNTILCNQSEQIQVCIKRMNDKQFNIYSGCFTHIQSICFNFKNEEWQRKTGEKIGKLDLTLQQLNGTLKDALSLQKDLIKLNNDSIKEDFVLKQLVQDQQNILQDNLSKMQTNKNQLLKKY